MSEIRETARSVALDVLVAVERDDAYANILLPQGISAARLDVRDAQLATELCHGTLRWCGYYDAVIDTVSSRSVDSLNMVVRNALRLGAHQLLRMRVETHAAVHETVDQVKAAKFNSAAGFVNAVLRRISEKSLDQWDAHLAAQAKNDVARLSVLYSHPEWIVRALSAALVADGRETELEELLQADNAAAALALIDLRDETAEIDSTDAARLSPRGRILSGGGNPSAVTKQFEGRVRVQDEGSQLAALALIHAAPLVAGERWLDMCSAPGGKSAVLAQAATVANSELVANELNPTRMSLVRSSLAPWPQVTITNRDGAEFADEPASFDRILVDAPCSGLGALRRRPESRWRKQPKDIAELTVIQDKLLNAALDAVKPQGIVAYVTCSPHAAETRGIVNQVLRKRSDVTELDAKTVIDSFANEPLGLTGSALSAQLWPHAHQTDAMFISLFRKH